VNRKLIIGAAVSVLIAGVVVVVSVNSGRGPEVTGREYVDHIAAGEWDAATAMVEPFRIVAGPAVKRINVVDVSAIGDDEVAVHYELDGAPSHVRLPVYQGPDELGVFERWRVRDPLLVGVWAKTTLARDFLIAGVRVGPTSISMYPGVYELKGLPSKYLTTDPAVVVVDHFHASLGGSVTAGLVYRATPALNELVQARLTEHAASCFAGSAAKGCPLDYRSFRDVGSDFAVAEQPKLDTVGVYADNGVTGLRFKSTPGRMTYVRDGKTRTQDFRVYGRVDVSPPTP